MTKAAVPTAHASNDSAGRIVKVSPRTVQAARLRPTINTRLGKPTSPFTTKIAVGR